MVTGRSGYPGKDLLTSENGRNVVSDIGSRSAADITGKWTLCPSHTYACIYVYKFEGWSEAPLHGSVPSASSYTRRIPPHLNVIDSVYKNNNCVVMRRTLTFSEQRCCFALHIYRVYRPYIKFLEVTCYNKLYIKKPRCLTVVAACREPLSSEVGLLDTISRNLCHHP